MIGSVLRNDRGEALQPPSLYLPSEEVKKLTAQVREDYTTGLQIQTRPYAEFNDKTIIDRQSLDQKAFGIYQDAPFVNPDEKWRWTGIRPLTRNKLISIAAHMLSSLLYPAPKAQNENDEEDKDMAEVMRLMIEHNLRKQNYSYNLIFAIIAALTNPALIVHVEYVEALQTVRTKLANGEIEVEEAVDDLVSGINMHIVPCEELLIANVYEHEIQRQRFLIRRRTIDFSEAKARYGSHDNFKHVRPGIKIFYSEELDGFYENHDTENPTLVEEIIYYNRTDDMEVPFVNGIYVGKSSVKANLFSHRRLVRQGKKVRSMPVYPYAKTGFEPIDEKRFFYYKSAAFKLGPDQTLTDRIWRLVVDGTFLSIIKPIINQGRTKINESVIFPGRVTNATDANIVPVDVQSDLNAGFNLLASLEQSGAESTQDKASQGVSTPGSQTAFEISRMEQNARTQLGLFGRMFARFVEDFGMLVIDCIIQHQTTGELEELMSKEQKVKYRNFLVPNQDDGGKTVTKKVVLTDEYAGRAMTEEESLEESFKMMDEEGGYDSDVRIYKVNPEKFSSVQFSVIVEADSLPPRSDMFEKAMKLEGYDRMLMNPLIQQDPEALNAITRDFLLEPYAKGNVDKYLPKKPAMPPMMPGQPTSSPLVQQMSGGNSLAALMGGGGGEKLASNITSQ